MMSELRASSGMNSRSPSRRPSLSRGRDRSADESGVHERSRSRGGLEVGGRAEEDEENRREREDRERGKRENQYISVEEWKG